MKVTPVAPGQGGMSTPGTSITLNTGRPSAVPPPTSTFDPDVEAAREAAKTRTIKMRVQQTPGPREYAPPATAEAAPAAAEATPAAPAASEAAPPPAEASPRSIEEQAAAPAEVTKPLSPQFAALAKQRRALQLKEREIVAREKALAEAPAPKADAIDVARLKAEPLSVLQEAGVTYDQLTEAILAGKEANPDIYKLKEEIKALKEGFDKSLSDRDAQAEAAAMAEMSREARNLAAANDEYELVRETKSIPKVMDLIQRTWKQSGEILSVPEAMGLVEGDLVEQSLRIAALKKVQGRLAPKPAPAPQPAAAAPAPGMKTLTNRDTTSVPLSRRDRAMQAFYGRK